MGKLDGTGHVRRRLLKTSPDHVATRRELALLILERDPRDTHTWGLLANALTELHEFRLAHDALRKLATLVTDDSGRYWLHAVTGNYLRGLGRLPAAERSYRKAAALSPLGSALLGAVLAKQGRFAEAKAWHRRAARAPEEEDLARDEAFYNLGLILRAERRYAAALGSFDRAIEIAPRYVQAREARDDVRRALRVVIPGSRRAHWRLVMRTVESQPATAHEVVRAYVRKYPTHFARWLALAHILATFARYQEAFDAVVKVSEDAVTEQWRESPGGAFIAQWGHVRLAQMDFERAETSYRKAIRLRGSRAHIYRVWLAEVLVKKGKFGEARRLLNHVVSSAPDDPSLAHYLLGFMARTRREYGTAINAFDAAIRTSKRPHAKARRARTDALKAMILCNQSEKKK